MIKKERNKDNISLIMIINSLDIGGAENILFSILENKNKNNILIISLTSVGYYGKELQKKGFKIISLNCKKNLSLINKFIELLKIINYYKPLIVHTWMYHANLFGGLSAKILGIKNIFWSIHHDYEYSNLIKKIEMKILSFLSHSIPSKIVFCSFSSKIKHLQKGYKPSISIVIENGINTDIFKPSNTKRKRQRLKLKIKEDCFLICNIARFHPIKDHANLLKALFLLENKVNFKCFLIGENIKKNYLKMQHNIKKFGLKEKVFIFGKSKKLYNLLNAFDLNILSSKSESSPLSLMEAMSCGIPSISTDVGDASKIIGDSGWIVSHSNSEELASMINYVYIERQLLKNKSKASRNRILENYSLEKMHYQYKKLYSLNINN